MNPRVTYIIVVPKTLNWESKMTDSCPPKPSSKLLWPVLHTLLQQSQRQGRGATVPVLKAILSRAGWKPLLLGWQKVPEWLGPAVSQSRDGRDLCAPGSWSGMMTLKTVRYLLTFEPGKVLTERHFQLFFKTQTQPLLANSSGTSFDPDGYPSKWLCFRLEPFQELNCPLVADRVWLRLL